MSRTSGNVLILQTQNEGYKAYLDGLHPRDCPYGSDTEENQTKQKAWFRGYAASRTDRARANRAASTPPAE